MGGNVSQLAGVCPGYTRRTGGDQPYRGICPGCPEPVIDIRTSEERPLMFFSLLREKRINLLHIPRHMYIICLKASAEALHSLKRAGIFLWMIKSSSCSRSSPESLWPLSSLHLFSR